MNELQEALRGLTRDQGLTLARMMADLSDDADATAEQRQFREDIARVLLAAVGLQLQGEHPSRDGLVLRLPRDGGARVNEARLWRAVGAVAVEPEHTVALVAIADLLDRRAEVAEPAVVH